MVSGVFCFVRKDSAKCPINRSHVRKYRYRIDRASPEGRRSRIEPGVFGSSPGRSNVPRGREIGLFQHGAIESRSVQIAIGKNRSAQVRRREVGLPKAASAKQALAEFRAAERGVVEKATFEVGREQDLVAIFETRAQQLAFVEPDRPHRRVFRQGHAQVATLEPTIGELAVAQVGA